MLMNLKNIVLSPTKHRAITHQLSCYRPLSPIVLSPTYLERKQAPMLASNNSNARARFFYYLAFLTQNLEGALPPLQTTLQDGKAKGMCAKRTCFLFLVAVTTKVFNSKALLFKPFFLKKIIKKIRHKPHPRGQGA